ncbi:hypothetical protein ACFLT2_10390 [Acidobacteriota bacterium]
MQSKFNYVEECLELFPKLTKIMFGSEYDLDEIENKLRNVKKDDRLDRNDLLRIRDAREWDYKKFWPDLITVVDLDKPIVGIFNLPWEENKKTISELYSRFLNIEVVSVILRFVDPQNFAIISPPVEKFFSLQPKEDHVEYYTSYLNLLKKTSKHFLYPNRLADVDMALWCLSFIMKNWGDKEFCAKWTESERPVIELIIHCYKVDQYFKKLRLCEALSQVYLDIGEDESEPNRLFLADCLDSEEIDPELAMIIVSFCFEKFLWDLIKETDRVEEFREVRSRKKWIEMLEGNKIFETSLIFGTCAELRDRSVHPWLQKLSPVEREDFIANMEKLIIKKKANCL